MDDALKGNYKVPVVDDAKTDKKIPEQESKDKLQEEFEVAALKRLGGSIAFVKKPGSKFVWGNKDDKNGRNKNE